MSTISQDTIQSELDQTLQQEQEESQNYINAREQRDQLNEYLEQQSQKIAAIQGRRSTLENLLEQSNSEENGGSESTE